MVPEARKRYGLRQSLASKCQKRKFHQKNPLPDLNMMLRKAHPDFTLIRILLPPETTAEGATLYPVGTFTAPVAARTTIECPSNVSIRSANSSDLDAWTEAFLNYRSSQIPAALLQTCMPDADAAKATWEAYRLEGNIFLLHDDVGQLAGAAHVAAKPAFDLEGRKPWGFLADIFVTSGQARGRGFGRALLKAVFDWASQESLEELRWYCLKDNEAAMRFYERCGFPPTGRTVWQYP
eukprot:TRINITY_DN5001_c0_g4_i1.p1 TRINITY_DN5001_c0_g4~~TRINITY_DN5001_c0_g4_i1.p1  ORF type:complete len:237 (+),score=44.81 TRINITY_DN5001_c0_g4_i1:101-811(+)